jgi:hypothetical protein
MTLLAVAHHMRIDIYHVFKTGQPHIDIGVEEAHKKAIKKKRKINDQIA